jgi:hypothetical protein
MPKIKLSDFQKTVNDKYADFEVHTPDGEVLLFVPALRMPKERRKQYAAVLDIQERAKADNGDDLYDVYRDCFRVSAKHPDSFTKLDALLGDDPAYWQELFVAFQEDSQAGEA